MAPVEIIRKIYLTEFQLVQNLVQNWYGTPKQKA